MRMDSKIPRTSTKMQMWPLLWVLLGQVCEGTWGVTLSAESPALPCTLTGNAAQSWHLPRPHCLWISISSSQVTNWNPRCFTCHSIIPDLRGNMPDSADCRTEPRPYEGWVPSLPRSISNSPSPCTTPEQCMHTQAFPASPVGTPQGCSFGQSLLSGSTQRTDSFLSSEMTTFLAGTCYRYNPHCLQGNSWACQSQEQHVWPSDALGLLMSYQKGDRDGLIKDCVHNHLLLSNFHSSQSGGKLCSLSTNTNSHKCASSGFGIEQENTERIVQQMLCHSSHCHLA